MGDNWSKGNQNNGIMGAIYGLSFIGSAVFFIQQSQSFWGGVLGFLKGMVWPAFMAYKVFEALYK